MATKMRINTNQKEFKNYVHSFKNPLKSRGHKIRKLTCILLVCFDKWLHFCSQGLCAQTPRIHSRQYHSSDPPIHPDICDNIALIMI